MDIEDRGVEVMPTTLEERMNLLAVEVWRVVLAEQAESPLGLVSIDRLEEAFCSSGAVDLGQFRLLVAVMMSSGYLIPAAGRRLVRARKA